MSSTQQLQPIQYKLTTKNLFKNFLLVHDFLYKFTRTQSINDKFLDAQIDVKGIMNNATAQGGRLGQIFSLGVVAVYCLRGKNIAGKFLAGFLYIYWLNHSYTLGQYIGALIKMPKAYKRVGEYYQKYEPKHPNLLDKFQQVMAQEKQYDDTNPILKNIFPQLYEIKSNSYTTNDYFVKNREKYNLSEQQRVTSNKLPYLDSFLTRYVYYSFTRWLHRVNLFLGLASQ